MNIYLLIFINPGMTNEVIVYRSNCYVDITRQVICIIYICLNICPAIQ